jgi:hypothetical protein
MILIFESLANYWLRAKKHAVLNMISYAVIGVRGS